MIGHTIGCVSYRMCFFPVNSDLSTLLCFSRVSRVRLPAHWRGPLARGIP